MRSGDGEHLHFKLVPISATIEKLDIHGMRLINGQEADYMTTESEKMKAKNMLLNDLK